MTDIGSEPPTPPDELDEDLREALEILADREPATLEAVATYATELARWAESTDRARSQPVTERDSLEDGETASSSVPDDVPEGATVSKTAIAGTTYRYYQWREGDEIKSKTVELE
ncbi:hypothetical protein D8Y22_02945 [Salinadaptatus halalkaliphilus]|uniref:Uncharacterized protein n=2 Tax=Salinadaptatus halalkaliphilus TaxID=2419781 RepID=A0A4V6RUE7_9EURY|nr:hypothetical protein [Salinadaptatus halalkaliphilus]THE66357.1 hypothetical protein D8Y22_02945 [Salinadaptatus halalkaliphilus]